MLPVDGKYIPGFPVEDSLNANGELVLPNKETVAGAYLFYYKRAYRLYVVPGREYKITIDPANKSENPVVVDTAPEPEAELALLKLAWDFSQIPGLRMYKQDSVFANNKQKVQQLMDSCLQPFDQLYIRHKISKPFYTYAKTCIKNYYGAVLATTLIQPVSNTVYQKDSTGYDAAVLNRLDDNWHEVLKMADVLDPVSMSTDTYQEYFYFYNVFYLNYFLYQIKGHQIVKGVDNGDARFINLELSLTKEPIREYCLATYLRTMILEDRFEIYIPDLYKEFIQQYPHSQYIKFLSDGVEKVKNFYAAVKSDFSTEQHLIPHYDSIQSVDELLSGFKGKTLYIDIWATWCGPCKEQFAFKKDLDAFLKSKGIEVLYISLDRNGSEQKWKDMIKYYNLEGHHIMCAENLSKDIYKVFGNGKSLSIPRYAICKDGKLILSDAKRPGDGSALYKQIESVL